MKPKFQNIAKLCYMDTDSFIIYIKTKTVYEDIPDGVEKDLIHQIMKSVYHCPQKK